MTHHLHGNIITSRGVSANNRGETEGNCTTLPKLFWGDELRVASSSESIRWAIRHFFQNTDEGSVNRVWNEEEQTFNWQDKDFDPKKYIDDDVMGYMYAQKGNHRRGYRAFRVRFLLPERFLLGEIYLR